MGVLPDSICCTCYHPKGTYAECYHEKCPYSQEGLRKRVIQRGARMQVMKEWMMDARCADATFNVWDFFLTNHPEFADYFDEHGVPK